MGAKIQLTPLTSAAGTYRVWYIPVITALTLNDSPDTALDMYDEYIVLRAAIMARKRQRRDTADLADELAMLVKDIRATAGDRDDGAPEVVGEVTADWEL
jgi:hypothetical protein